MRSLANSDIRAVLLDANLFVSLANLDIRTALLGALKHHLDGCKIVRYETA